jgi:phosphatidylglycerophosphate synthase
MANLLTAVRLLLIIPFAWSMANPELLPALVPLLMLVLAITTDYFDGIVARARNTASPAGQLFDHSTDFLFVSSGLAGLAYAGTISPFLPALIVVAFTQYVLDSYFLFYQKQLRMSFLGRWNGIFYFAPLLLIALSRLFPSINLFALLEMVATLSVKLLIVTTLLSIVDRGLAPLRRSRP